MLPVAASLIFASLLAAATGAPVQQDGCPDGEGTCLRDQAETDEASLIQQHRRTERRQGSVSSTCDVGASVKCSVDGSVPGTCAGDQCCANATGTVTCPSASKKHLAGCALAKAYDCTDSDAGACSPQPNPPTRWGQGTYIFSPADSTADIQAKVDAAYATNGGQDPQNNGQFSDKRFAFLFHPGEYKVNVSVGFYTSVAGMGDHPDKVVFSSEKGVYSTEGAWNFQWGALDTFWRSAENFKNEGDYAWWGSAPLGMLWAVSQAAPLRRVHAMHDVWVAQYQPGNDAAGYASGGFMADSKVEGKVQFMSQQQFFTRNVEASDFVGGAWNFVHVGDTGGVPKPVCPGPPAIAVEPKTPKVAEKPYIVSDGAKLSLHVPAVRTNSQGPAWADSGTAQDVAIDFEHVYVATDADSAQTINDMIACDNIKALVLAAGTYKLEAAIRISKPDFVVLGLGLATLIPTQGSAAIEVAGGIGNVRLASVLLQAGMLNSHKLLDWGSPDPALRDAPTSVISDLFVRNGGPDAFDTFVDTFVHIKTNNVIGDNLWLWRADHSVNGQTNSKNFHTDHGIVVDGDNCIFYGLMVEHTLKTLTTWNGEGGQTYFYQSELPYSVYEREFGVPGYVGYHVADGVKTHKAVGIGVYSNFNNEVTVKNAILTPAAATVEQSMSVHLNGNGTIQHVVNGEGAATHAGNQRSVVCSFPH